MNSRSGKNRLKKNPFLVGIVLIAVVTILASFHHKSNAKERMPAQEISKISKTKK